MIRYYSTSYKLLKSPHSVTLFVTSEKKIMMNTPRITLAIEEINAYCRTQAIVRLSLFGSVIRDDFTAESDVDVLVEFEVGAKITYFDLYEIQQALEKIIKRKIDLLTPNALSEYFRDKVLETAQVIYEASS